MPSSYSKFKYKDLEDLGLKCRLNNLFHNIDIPYLEPSELFELGLERRSSKKLASEKSKSENITVPILDELETINQKTIAVYSGYLFDVDKTKGLRGECDFILAKNPDFYAIDFPVFCVVQAFNDNLDDACPECIAQMYAAQIYNEKWHGKTPIIYGATTSGTLWKFLQLTDKEAIVDEKIYYITELPKLLGVLNYIVNQ